MFNIVQYQNAFVRETKDLILQLKIFFEKKKEKYFWKT